MKKFVLTCIILMLISIMALGQQSPNWSSFYDHGFITNPALTAYWSKVEVTATHRQEWTGFESAPQVSSLGLQYPFIKKITRVSVGAFLENDKVGPYGKRSVGMTYSYRIVPGFFGNKLDQLRFGLGVQGSQLRYDPEKVVFFDGASAEPGNIANEDSRWGANINMGLFYLSIDDFNEFKSHYYLGLSVNQPIPGLVTTALNSSPHASFHIGYRNLRSKRSKKFLEPNLLVMYAWSRAINVMANLRYEQRDAYWAAAGIVSNGDIYAQCGVILDEDSLMGFMLNQSVIRLGVKADYNVGHLRPYAGMGFEAYLAYMFDL